MRGIWFTGFNRVRIGNRRKRRIAGIFDRAGSGTGLPAGGSGGTLPGGTPGTGAGGFQTWRASSNFSTRLAEANINQNEALQ
jgi:hypothetical protein